MYVTWTWYPVWTANNLKNVEEEHVHTVMSHIASTLSVCWNKHGRLWWSISYSGRQVQTRNKQVKNKCNKEEMQTKKSPSVVCCISFVVVVFFVCISFLLHLFSTCLLCVCTCWPSYDFKTVVWLEPGH